MLAGIKPEALLHSTAPIWKEDPEYEIESFSNYLGEEHGKNEPKTLERKA